MKKIYIDGEKNNIKVGMCKINLSDTRMGSTDGNISLKRNNTLTIYDTSGPYGDNSYVIDFKKGLPRIRKAWYEGRKDVVSIINDKTGTSQKKFYRAKDNKHVTQLFYAKKRMITPEMEYVAIRENQQIEALGLKSYITPEFVRKEIASGRAVIPSNINHLELEPMIIGNRFLVKTNCNLILDKNMSETDREKIILSCRLGVDTMMDISYETSSSTSLELLLRNSPVPVGTPPIYEALARADGKVENLTWEIFRDTLIEQLERGVDFISIHPAMRRKHVQMASNRLCSINSFSGRILEKWMKVNREENFLYTNFRNICEIANNYDAVISLGCGLRSDSVYDSNDPAQLAELSEMRELIEIAWEHYVQVMSESSGHIPLNKIEALMKEYRYVCKNTPFFSPGMVTSDLAIGHEHIASAIGGAQMAWYGASLIGGLKSQSKIKDLNQLKTDLLSYKIAAHSADLAKGHPGAQVRDNAFSKAQNENRSKDCFKLSLSSAIQNVKL
jgi:phosphomethylpyrimidine synthase